MFNYFKMPNDIDFTLSDAELTVMTYLYSIKGFKNLYGQCVKVKQETISRVCKISVPTVARVLKKLMSKGIILNKVRSIKCNGQLSTCYYVLNPISKNDKFFLIDRKALLALSPRLIKPYLFICRSIDNKSKCYQSYSDIAVATGIKRSDVIAIMSELCKLKLIRKRKKLTRQGDYTDNTYIVIKFILPRIHKKRQKKMSCFSRSKLINNLMNKLSTFTKYCTQLCRKCQAVFFHTRGSPLFDRSIILPTSILSVRKKE